MGLRSRRRREGETTSEHEPVIGEEHAWWAERDGLQRVFVASSDHVSDGDDSGLSDFWSPESLFTYDQRAEDTTISDAGEDLADPHGVLGVTPSSSWSDVAVAHRKLAKRYHPDLLLHADPREREEAEQRMRLINQAYSQLQRHKRAAAT